MNSWLAALIPTVLGIASTLLAYYFNPKRKIYVELDQLLIEKENWERKRDEALVKNDRNVLTVATAYLLRIKKRQAELLQRLGNNNLR
jgi:hypothetical protein